MKGSCHKNNTNGNGLGQLASATSPDYFESHGYDSLGRATKTTTVIKGESFTVNTSYDNYSRPEAIDAKGNVTTLLNGNTVTTTKAYDQATGCSIETRSDGSSSKWCDDGTSEWTDEQGNTSVSLYNHETGCSVTTNTDGSSNTWCEDGSGSWTDADGNEQFWNEVRDVTAYHMQAFARFLDEMAAVQDPTGQSLMDRLLVYGCSEYGEGWKHGVKEMPVVMAGGASGALQRGVHVREAGGNMAKAQLTMLKALGLSDTAFGFNGAETSDTFAGLLS